MLLSEKRLELLLKLLDFPGGRADVRGGFLMRYVKTGVVKFPCAGCEQLVTQLHGFGIEKHDDAVDALVSPVALPTRNGRRDPLQGIGA